MIGHLLMHRRLCRSLIALLLALLLGGPKQSPTHALPLTLVHTTVSDFLAGASDGNIIVTENGGGALELARQPTDQGIWTKSVADLPLSVLNHSAVLVGRHLFVIGGYSGPFRVTNILRSTVDANGNLSSWRVMPRLPLPYVPGRLSFGAGGHLFVEGGIADSENPRRLTSHAVFSSPVDAQGSLGPWRSLGAWPDFTPNGLASVRDRMAIAADGYAFVLASHQVGEGRQSVIYRASIGAGGTLGEWAAVTALPEALEGFAVVAYNHHLIVSGGRTAWQPDTGDRVPRDTIYRAPIRGDGSLGEWSVWGTLPEPLVGHTMTVAGGNLIVTADELGRDEEPTALFAAHLSHDGMLGAWQRLSDVPVNADASPQLTTASGHVFLTGGHVGTGVYRLALGAHRRIGQWAYYGSSRGVRDLKHRLGYATSSGDYLFILGAPETAETPVYSHRVEGTTPAGSSGGDSGQDLTWTPQTPLPEPVGGRLLATHGAVYFVGNTEGDQAVRAYRAPITAPGELGQWEALPTPVTRWRSLYLDAVGDRLLVLACLDDASLGDLYPCSGNASTTEQPIYSVAVDDAGLTSDWVLAGQPPAGSNSGVLAATGGQVTYLTGDRVYQASLLADGRLGEWRLGSVVFPRNLESPGVATANGFLFALDGFKNVGVYTVPILRNGLADWTAEAPLPSDLWDYDAYASATGSYLFDFAGLYHDELYRAPLAPSAAHGSFTGQFDLGAEYVMNRLAWVVEGSAGTVRVRYRIAGEDGAFGPWTPYTTTHPIDPSASSGRGPSAGPSTGSGRGLSTAPGQGSGEGSELRLPGNAVGRYLEYQLDLDSSTDDYFAVTEVSLLRGVNYVTVQDEAGQPVEGAVVFRNGELLVDADGNPLRTGADGRLSVETLQVGDTLAAMAPQLEQPTDKDTHDGWAYRIYLTSLEVQPDGQLDQHVVTTPGEQIVTVRRDQPLVLFNVVVSVEWNAYTFADANPGVPFDTYLKQLARGFRSASNTLYDATDGQFAFGSVTIYDDGRFWDDADFQVLASNQVRPRAVVGGITTGRSPHRYASPNGPVDFHPGQVRLGRFWRRTSGAAGAWDQPDGFRTIAHEFAHYALYLYDEYYNLGADAQVRTAHCTTPAIRTNRNAETNASLMDWHYNATELAMTGTDLWDDACHNTAQWQVYGESDWETVVGNYRDVEQPARWIFRTPASHGVNPGPNFMPLALPSIQVVAGNVAPATNPILDVIDAGGALLPTQQVRLYLLKQTGDRVTQVLDQGTTNFLGQVEVRGADSSDRLVGITWDGTQQGGKLLDTSDPLRLSPSRWTPAIDARPRPGDSGLEITVSGVPTLTSPLSVSLFSGRTVVSTTLLPADGGFYTGSLSFDPAQPIEEGHLMVQGLDGEGAQLETFASFATGGVGPIHRDQHPPLHPASGDGNLQLIVPGGHAPEGMKVLVLASRGLPAPLPAGLVLVGGPYTVRATEALTGPAALAMYYQEEVVAAVPRLGERDIRIYHWLEPEARWQDLGGTLDPEVNLVSTVVEELGVYLAVAGARPTPTPTSGRVFLPAIFR